jgi:hypothetical protein
MKRITPFLLAAAVGSVLLQPGDARAATSSYGRINVTMNIFVVTPIPSGDVVACQVTATGDDSLTTNSETAFLPAVQISASPLEYQCKFSIPWEWLLGNAPSVPVSITASAGYIPSGSTSVQGLVRISTHTLNGFSTPSNLSTPPATITWSIDMRT